MIFATTGYAWGTLHGLNAGLSTNDVIGSGLNQSDGATDILLVGNDSRTDAQGNPLPEEILKQLRTTDDEGGDLTDTMILMRIPNGGGRASAVSFPRDTLVELGQGFGEQKLNSAMGRAKQAARTKLESEGVTDEKELEKKSTAQGQKFLVQTIEKLSGVGIDHYAEINLLGFYEMTKAVGGVEVCLKEPVDDSDYSGAVFDAGPQKVQGADALAFVRQRHGLPRGDLDRVVRQQVFMSGLARQMLSSGTLANPSRLSDLVTSLQKSIVLDDNWDVMKFAQQMQGIAAGNIEFHTIPVELDGSSGSEDVTADKQKVQTFVDDLLLPPKERAAKQQQNEAKEAQRAETTVNVYNASGVSGLAGEVRSKLGDQGYQEGDSGNAESMSKSVVQHAPGEAEVAQQIADSLGGISVEESSELTSGSAAIYLGDDYKGPGAQNFAGSGPMQLDGARQAKPQPAQEPSSGTEEQTITADGVPCVF
ncbi:LytR family transcriptional regulator [Allosaccharopolyspora coralli]|uniref:LytR family transcriptional regulator n=2 Tax=Allosaccharopolyspora coralli TaxID=2665642 RepID=A0A5Q3QG99_9PSEU|nr:LytR family transcriptional regulator [Allosaccharopolyspora coralli]